MLETTPEIGGDVLAKQIFACGARQIFACGGDGTIMKVVNDLARTLQENNRAAESDESPVLSIVPGGTANLLAAALDIPHDVEKAIAIAVVGEDKILDLGRCGEHFFALGVGLGLTERLVSQATTDQKGTLGKAVYVLAMLKELGAKPVPFTLKRDQKAVSASAPWRL